MHLTGLTDPDEIGFLSMGAKIVASPSAPTALITTREARAARR
jgi:hypothetical protein